MLELSVHARFYRVKKKRCSVKGGKTQTIMNNALPQNSPGHDGMAVLLPWPGLSQYLATSVWLRDDGTWGKI
jgi:hypothetical protein